MQPTITKKSLLAVFAGLCLSGCAHTGVKPQYAASGLGGQPRPTQILVYDFAVDAETVKENQAFFNQVANAMEESTVDERANQIGRQAAIALAEEVVAGIRELGLSARRVTRHSEVPAGAVALTGQFLNIDEGNRLKRLVVGLGAGQSKLETQARLVAPAGEGFRTLLEFTTDTDSGAMPGAALTMGAGAAAQGGATVGMAAANVAVGGVKTYRSATEQMAATNGGEIVAYLSEQFAKQGWISADRVRKATRSR